MKAILWKLLEPAAFVVLMVLIIVIGTTSVFPPWVLMILALVGIAGMFGLFKVNP